MQDAADRLDVKVGRAGGLFGSGRDVALWHIASFRCATESSRYPGIAEIEQASPSILIYEDYGDSALNAQVN